MRLVFSHQPLGSRFPGFEAQSSGAGRWSDFVHELAAHTQQQMRESIVLYGDVLEVEREIWSVAAGASHENWDGDGAAAVTARTAECAVLFARALPGAIPIPEVYAESRGEITFEWYAGPRKTIMFSVFNSGEIGYAALVGEEKGAGRVPFVGELPQVALALLRKVVL